MQREERGSESGRGKTERDGEGISRKSGDAFSKPVPSATRPPLQRAGKSPGAGGEARPGRAHLTPRLRAWVHYWVQSARPTPAVTGSSLRGAGLL